MRSFLVLLILLNISSIIQSQIKIQESKGGNKNKYIYVPPPNLFKNNDALYKTVNTKITVNYSSSVPYNVRTAFDYAASLWSSWIISGQEIIINVDTGNFAGTNTLASASTNWKMNFSNAPFQDHYYPTSLAKKYDPSVKDPSGYDILIKYDPNLPWSFETNGQFYETTYDFVTVMLHEIAHGLGLSGSFNISGGKVSKGFDPDSDNKFYPAIFDKYCVEDSKKIYNVQDADSLKMLLQSQNVEFDGLTSKAANFGKKPKLFSPTVFEEGSSIYHLDDSTFGKNLRDRNSLMTSSIDYAEVIHAPGEIAISILKDIGWNIERYLSVISPGYYDKVTKGSIYTIKWFDNIQSNEKVDIILNKVVNDVDYPQEKIIINAETKNSNNNFVSWTVDTEIEDGNYRLEFVYAGGLTKICRSDIFSITTKPQPVYFTPVSGSYGSEQEIKLLTSTNNCIIRYTLDNTEPNVSSNIHDLNDPIVIKKTTVIRAKAFLTKNDGSIVESDESRAEYRITYTDISKKIVSSGITYYYTPYNQSSYNKTDRIELGNISNPKKVARTLLTFNGFNIIPKGSIIRSVILKLPFTTDGEVIIKKYVPGTYSSPWDDIDKSSKYSTVPVGVDHPTMDLSSSAIIKDIQSIIDGDSGSNLQLGLMSVDEENQQNRLYYATTQIEMVITYSPNVFISQLDQNGNNFGAIDVWEDTKWSNHIAPHGMNAPINSNITIKAYDGITGNTNEKFSYWKENSSIINHNTFNIIKGDNNFTAQFESADESCIIRNKLEGFELNGNSDKIWFKDPWLSDYVDNVFGGSYRNRGMNAPYKSHSSPFQPKYSTKIDNDLYKGVFLNKEFDKGFYYSIKSPETQDIYLSQTGKAHKFYFQNWSSTGTQTLTQNSLDFDENGRIFYQTPVVFEDPNARVYANYKGHLLSGTPEAFSENNQRKLIRTPEGIYHLVYESMGSLWYTYSLGTNFNGEWEKEVELFRDIDAFRVGEMKNPSLDYYYNTNYNLYDIVITFEYQKNGETFIYSESNLLGYGIPQLVAVTENYGSAKPVIYCLKNANLIIYKSSNQRGYSYRIATASDYNFWGEEKQIIGTTSTSINLAVAGNKNQNTLHIVYEDNSKIKYLYTELFNHLVKGIFPSSIELSLNSGYTNNNYPSVSTTYGNKAVVSWKGSEINILEKSLPKENADGIKSYYTVTRIGSNTSWSSFSSFGTDAEKSSVGAITGSEKAVIAWTENNGSRVKYVKRENGRYSAINSITPSGKSVVLSNGENSLFEVKAMVYKTYAAAPYEINLSPTTLGTQQTNQTGEDAMAKVNSGTNEKDNITSGRSGVISKNGVELVFAIGDIRTENEKIEFMPFTDTLQINNIEELNERLRTKSFDLKENDHIYLSNYYYSVRGKSADTALTETDKAEYKIELVSEKTGEVISTLDKGKFDKFNLETDISRSYEVDCKGIEDGKYYLRIMIESEGIESCNLNDIYYEESELSKENYIQIGLNNENVKITEYELYHNYPNPFNPATTINYQLPEAGLVTLKVYDMLGQEVRTLVNEMKHQGRYSVQFNASNLASGTYIYEIKVNDFRKTQKMMLVK